MRFLWRTDYAPPGRIFSVPVTVEARAGSLPVVAGRRRRLDRPRHRHRARDPRPAAAAVAHLRRRGRSRLALSAQLEDRAREWLAFERWSGHVDQHDHRRRRRAGAAAAAAARSPRIALAGAAMLLARRRAGMARRAAAAVALAIMFVAAWLVLDARWTWNLARQVGATVATVRRQGLARASIWPPRTAPLFEFVEKVRAEAAGRAGARVRRGRRRLLPRPRRVSPLPAQRLLRSVDATRCRRRRRCSRATRCSSISAAASSSTPAQEKLRWDGGAPVAAELLVRRAGAALFRIR